MKEIIDIPNNIDLRNYDIPYTILDIITSGIPIPDNATNGDMIKAMFPNIEITYHNDNIELYNKNSISAEVLYQWWNASYKRGDLDDSN